MLYYLVRQMVIFSSPSVVWILYLMVNQRAGADQILAIKSQEHVAEVTGGGSGNTT
jgi:hypothetical protein